MLVTRYHSHLTSNLLELRAGLYIDYASGPYFCRQDRYYLGLFVPVADCHHNIDRYVVTYNPVQARFMGWMSSEFKSITTVVHTISLAFR